VVEGDYAVPIVKAMGLSYEKQESEYQQDFWDSIVQANLSKILGSKSFDDWNMDGGSGIDAKELEKHVDAATAKKLMAQFDADGDGQITKEEFELAKQGHKIEKKKPLGFKDHLASPSYKDWNKDGKGGVDLKELTQYVDLPTAKGILARYDINGDGQLSKDEYERAVGDARREFEAKEKAAKQSETLAIFTINDVYAPKYFPAFAGFCEQNVKQNKYAQTFRTLPGDFLSPVEYSSLDQGAHVMKFLDLCDINYICPGNHEFDFGMPNYEKLMAEYVSKDSEARPRRNIATNFKGLKHSLPYDISVSPGGFKIGWISACVVKSTPKPHRDIMTPEFEALQSTARMLKEEKKVDLVVALTHLVVAEDKKVMAMQPKYIDILLGGHDHDEFMLHGDG
jgi:Ca2+-binding EF-hand superfamily protein